MVTTRAQRGTKADVNDPPAKTETNILKAPPKRAGRKKAVAVEELVEAPKPATKAAAKTTAKPTAKLATTRRKVVKEPPKPPAEPVVEEPVEEPKPAPAKGKRGVAKKPAPRGKAAAKAAQQEEEPEPVTTEETPQEPQPAPTRRTRAKAQPAGAVAAGKKVAQKEKPVEGAPPAKVTTRAKAGTRKRKAEEDPSPKLPEPEAEKPVEAAPAKAPARGRAKKQKVDHEAPVEKPEVPAEMEQKQEAPKKTTRGRKAAVKEPEKPAPVPRVRATRKPTKVNEIKIVTSSAAAAKRPTRSASKETVPVVEPVQEAAKPKSPEPSKLPVKATPGRTPAKPENISIPHVEDPFVMHQSPLKAPAMKITSLSPMKLIAMEPPNTIHPTKEASPLKSSSFVQPGPATNLTNSLFSASPRKAPVVSPLKQPPISPVKLRGEHEQSTPGPLFGNSLLHGSTRKAPAVSVLNQPPISPVKIQGEREHPTPGPHFSNSLIHGSARKPPTTCFSLPGSAVKATPNVFEGKSSLLKSCPRKIHFPSIPKPDSAQTGSSVFGESRFTSSLFKSSPMKLKSPAKFPIMTPAKPTIMSPVPEKTQEESQMGALKFITPKAIFSVAAAPEVIRIEPVQEEVVETEQDVDVTMEDAPEPSMEAEEAEEAPEAVDVFAQANELTEASPELSSTNEAHNALNFPEPNELPKAVPELDAVNENDDAPNPLEAHEFTETVPESSSPNEVQEALNPAILQLIPDLQPHGIADNVQADVDAPSVVSEEANTAPSGEAADDSAQTPPESPLLDETEIQMELCRTPMQDDFSYIQTTPEATTPLSPLLNAQARSMASPSPRAPTDVEEETLRFGEPVFDCLMNVPQLQLPTDTPAQPEVSRPVTPDRQCQTTSVAPAWSVRGALSELPIALASPIKSSLRSPLKKLDAKTPRKTVTWQTTPKAKTPETQTLFVKDGPLNGTVFFVDVQSEGKDMGSLFVSLLEDMGAQVVPNWTSNNMGITHVLYKDGSQMTLEKVIASNGDVKCVNVGWALDCEKHGKRMDEAGYLISLSSVPGYTPKPLSKLNVNNSPTRTPVRTPARTPLKFFDAMTPICFTGAMSAPATPLDDSVVDNEDKENSPPKTPYFLHPKELVQKTCPPKHSAKASFDFSGAQTPFRQRLMAAKRRSAEFAPKLSSPLKRGRLG